MTTRRHFSAILLTAITTLALYFIPHLSKHLVYKEGAMITIEEERNVRIRTLEGYQQNNILPPQPSATRGSTSPIKVIELDASSPGVESSAEGNSEFDAIEHFSPMFLEPAHFIALRNMNQLASSLIAHHAYMSGRPLSAEDSNLFFQNNPRYDLQIAIEAMCPDCLLGLLYYEKNVSGGEIGIEQYQKIMSSKELMHSLVEAAKSEDYFNILFSKTLRSFDARN